VLGVEIVTELYKNKKIVIWSKTENS